MKKTVTILTMMSALLFASYADDVEDSFDKIFFEEEDTETPLVSFSNNSSNSKNDIITFSGKLTSDLGFAYIYKPNADETDLDPKTNLPKEKIHNNGLVFTLTNDFYINARPSDTFSVKADIKTTFANQFSLALNELYFTYNPNAYIYFSAGKKSTTWGNVKILKKIPKLPLFNSEGVAQENNCNDMNTNIFCDISNHLTIQTTIPWATGSFSFLTFYDYSNLESDSFTYDDMKAFGIDKLSFAASVEQTVFHTNINLFARLYDGKDYNTKTLKDKYKNPVVGLELKKTLFNVDFYAQNLLRIVDSFNEDATTTFEKEVFTFGFYNKTSLNNFTFGVNGEYQYQNEYINDISEHLFAFQTGISDFGPSNGFKVGATWTHNFVSENGSTTFIFQVSKLIPYVTVKTGVKTEYDSEGVSNVSSGVTFTLSGTY